MSDRRDAAVLDGEAANAGGSAEAVDDARVLEVRAARVDADELHRSRPRRMSVATCSTRLAAVPTASPCGTR